MTIWRPSIFGKFSILPASLVSSATRSSKLATQFLVGHFAATEPQGDFNLVAVFQKLEHVAHFDFVVVAIGVRAELNLFDLDDLLLLTRLSFFLLSFVFEFAIVHDFADRRVRVWRNLDKVEPCFFCHFHGALWRYNACVFAVRPDQADIGPANAFVDTGACVALWWRVMGSASYDLYPLVVGRGATRNLDFARAALQPAKKRRKRAEIPPKVVLPLHGVHLTYDALRLDWGPS